MRVPLLLLWLLFLWMTGCSQPSSNTRAAPAAAEPLLVDVAVVETRKSDRTISVTGSLLPDETVIVSSEVGGRLVAIHVDFGQPVRQGDVIAEIDQREYRLQLDRSKAALAQALARVGLDPGQVDVTPSATPSIRQAEAQFEDARSKYESAQRLVKTGDIARERFTEMEKAYIARRAVLDAARDELRTQLALIQALRADVALAEKRLNDTVVKAPFGGSVAARMVAPGQYIKDNTPIVSLVKTSPLRLRLEVPESTSASVRLGTSLRFTTDAIPGAGFEAVVRELNPALDARSRTLSAEARLARQDERLRPGMFVQVELVVERDANILVVPEQALQTVAGLTKVFTVHDGKAVEHRITPGPSRDGWVEVPSGRIRPGEWVALNRLAQLVDGMPVRTKRAQGDKG